MLLAALGLVAALGVSTVLVPWPGFAQATAIHYLYDDLDRLVGLVDQHGNVATYTYDAVGNLLRIDRVDAAALPGPVRITLVTPGQGTVDTIVQIFGTGFSPTPGATSVRFNDTPAAVTSASSNRLVTKVPAGASTGRIAVAAPLGSALSPTVFRVLGALGITPPGAVVLVGATLQFIATDTANPDTAVRWSVDGVDGGWATVGTVTSGGLYTAPATVPIPPVVTLTATATDHPVLSASVPILLVDHSATALGASALLSVHIGSAPDAGAQVATTSAAPVGVRIAVAPPGDPADTPAVPRAPGVSVRVDAPASGATSGSAALHSAVGVAREPVVVTVTPVTGHRGSVDLAITLTGAGFTGATGVAFVMNGVDDPAIAVSGVTVSADGTRATVTIAVAADAVSGGRVVRITTPGASSSSIAIGGNVFIVQ